MRTRLIALALVACLPAVAGAQNREHLQMNADLRMLQEQLSRVQLASNQLAEQLKVLNKRLDGREYVADDYSIADVAIWPWISRFEWQTIDMKQYPNVLRWYLAIAKKPATVKGYKVPKDVGDVPIPA